MSLVSWRQQLQIQFFNRWLIDSFLIEDNIWLNNGKNGDSINSESID